MCIEYETNAARGIGRASWRLHEIVDEMRISESEFRQAKSYSSSLLEGLLDLLNECAGACCKLILRPPHHVAASIIIKGR